MKIFYFSKKHSRYHKLLDDYNILTEKYNQLDGDIWSCNCPCCGKPVITSEAPLIHGLEIVPISMKKR